MTIFSLQVKRLLEINKVGITRVDCTAMHRKMLPNILIWVYIVCHLSSNILDYQHTAPDKALFQLISMDSFLISHQKLRCWYSLEVPQ